MGGWVILLDVCIVAICHNPDFIENCANFSLRLKALAIQPSITKKKWDCAHDSIFSVPFCRNVSKVEN